MADNLSTPKTPSSLKECSVCEEDFNENERIPRTLPCSHYLCADCINKMIKNNLKQCPFCRLGFEASSAEDIMVNRAVIDFIKCMPCRLSTPLAERIASKERENAEIQCCIHQNCEDAKAEVERVMRNIEKISKDLQCGSTTLCEEILPKIIAMKEEYARKEAEIEEIKENMNNRLAEISKKEIKLRDVKSRIEDASSFKEAASLMDEAEVTNAAVGEWIENCKGLIRDDKEKIEFMDQDMQETKEKIENIADIMSILWGKGSNKTITIELLQRMSNPVKNLVEKRKVFAVQVQQEAMKSARISIQDKRLCLHHLKSDTPPTDAYTIDHQDILRLVDTSSRLAFLDLSFKGLALGRLYIRLKPDTNGARQFAMLCTGQAGPTYANTKLFCVQNMGLVGERVFCGDYENQNGTGGKGLLANIFSFDKAYERLELNGTITGVGWWKMNHSLSAQFIIRTRGHPNKLCVAAFGIVEEGLDVLTDAIHRSPNIKNISIQDCGLVLSCSL